MVGAQVIHLFIPACGPYVLADELDGVQGFCEHGPVTTQSASAFL